jgi:hypothetical protein
MMTRKTVLMLATALVLATGALGGAGLAMAQPGTRGGSAATAPIYDPAQLPAFKGKVAQYSLTPRGEVDGLILADGTEVHVPPFVSTQLVFAVRPGDAVTIHGLKARELPMVAARSVTNDASGVTVLVMAPQGGHAGGQMGGHMGGRMGWHMGGTALEAEGKVAATLHTPRGQANGVRLEDGTIVRMPPGEAKRLAETLAVGKSVAVRGAGYAGPLGRVIAARQIGETKDSLKDVAGPRAGDGHGREHRMMRHGGHDGHGQGEHRRGEHGRGGHGQDGHGQGRGTGTPG